MKSLNPPIVGYYAVNPVKGERRLVIGYIAYSDEVTFSGDSKWYTAKGWTNDGWCPIMPPYTSLLGKDENVAT